MGITTFQKDSDGIYQNTKPEVQEYKAARSRLADGEQKRKSSYPLSFRSNVAKSQD